MIIVNWLAIVFLSHFGFLFGDPRIIFIYAPIVANQVLVSKKKCNNVCIPLN